MKRNTLTRCMLLSLAMIASSTSLWGQSFTDGPLKYDVTGTGEVAVSNADKNGNTGVITIPATVTNNGVTYTVTSVAKEGFKYSKITGVNFPSTITAINQSAFAESKSLKSVVIPKSVATIGSSAFEYSENIESLSFEPGSALTAIEHHTFKCLRKVTELEIPEGVTSIGDWALEQMQSMSELTLPSTLTTLGDGCLADCESMDILTINAATPPATNGRDPFRSAFPYTTCTLVIPQGSEAEYKSTAPYSNFLKITSEKVKNVKFVQGDFTYKVILTADGEVALTDVASSVADAVIPASVTYEGKTYKVTTLYNGAFSGKSVKSVQIPVGVKFIGDRCFYNSKLAEIVLPDGLETIGKQAFSGTNIQNFVIPNSVTLMGQGCFPGSTKSIQFSANCPVIPKSVCVWSQLAEIVIPEGVTTIEEEAFVCNSKVTSIMLPSTLTTVGNKVFGESDAITSVTIAAAVAPTGGNDVLFSQTVYNNATLTIPEGSGESYAQTAPWDKFSKVKEIKFTTGKQFEDGDFIYESITDKTAKVVGYKGSEASIIIPNAAKRNEYYVTVVEIGENAFANSSVTSVEIGQSISAVGSKAFAGITLNAIKAYPTTPPECADDSFTAETYSGATLSVNLQCKDAYSKANGWKNFTNIVEEAEVGSVFVIDNLEYTVIEEGCVSVGYTKEALEASKTDKSLTKIIVPETVNFGGIEYTVTAVTAQGFKELGCSGIFASDSENHVKDCVGTIDFVLPETVEEIGEEAFYFAHIKSINMPESLTTLGKSCFMGAKIEGTVTVPGTVTDIPEDALSWAWGIEKIILEDGVETIATNAFMASKMTEITLPASIGSITDSFALLMGLQKVNVADLEAYLSLSLPGYMSSPFDATGARLYCDGKEVKEIDYRKYDFTTVSDYLFKGCPSLETLIFSKDFTDIGYQTFNNCPNIKDIYCYSETPITCHSYNPEFSNNVYQTAILHIPANTYDAYVASPEWKRFANIEEMDPSGVENVDADNSGIRVDGNKIINPLGLDVKIYDTTGRMIYSGNEKAIETSLKGIVIVKCDGVSIKVVI